MENDINFETLLKELEQIVEKLESNECSLNDSLKLFEQGTERVKRCNEILENAKLKIEALTTEKKGLND